MSETISHSLSIQGQKAICERSYTNIVCWTPRGISIARIYRDKEHFNQNWIQRKCTKQCKAKEIGTAQTAKVHHEFVYTVPAHIIVSVAKLFKVQ